MDVQGQRTDVAAQQFRGDLGGDATGEAATARVAPSIDIANGSRAFLLGHEMRAGGRDQLIPARTPK